MVSIRLLMMMRYDAIGTKYSNKKDPNAMDIDSLSVDERTKLMKEGKCFICRQTGHMAKDHKKNDSSQKQWKEEAPKYEQVEAPKKKWEGNALYAHVRSMIAELDTEEKEKFGNGAEDSGFQKGELNQRQFLLVSKYTL